jgi:hypothetical protein
MPMRALRRSYARRAKLRAARLLRRLAGTHPAGPASPRPASVSPVRAGVTRGLQTARHAVRTQLRYLRGEALGARDAGEDLSL